MTLGEAASFGTMISATVALLALGVNIKGAVGKRQRELRRQLREVCRDIAKACDDYRIASRRPSAGRSLSEASEKLKVIQDEGILSPARLQIREFDMWVYDLSTRDEGESQLSRHLPYVMKTKEELDRSLVAYRENTELTRVYVSKLAAKYRHVTSKMDNGNMLTYWHYRLLPPFINRGAPKYSRPSNSDTASEE